MKYFFILFCQFFLVESYSQDEEVFKVYQRNDIRLQPDLDTLMAGDSYTFTVTGIASSKISSIRFSGELGKTTMEDSIITIHINSTKSYGKEYILKLLTKSDSLSREVFEKKFVIIPLVSAPSFEPSLNQLTGVNIPDVTLGDLIMLCKNCSVSIKDFRTLHDYKLKMASDISCIILSFKIVVDCNGITNEFISNNNQLTGKMIDAINDISTGCTLTFSDIRYLNPKSPDEHNAGPFVIHVKG